MAIFQALFAAVARSAGKVLNTVFAWATTLLFGKVSEDKQTYLSGATFGSVIWLVVVLGIIFPRLGAVLLVFIRPPRWLNHNWIRLIMLAAAIIIPILIGLIAAKLESSSDKPRKSESKLKTILKGYPYTLGLATTLVLMILFAPVMKLRTIARRWETQHMAVLIDPEDYKQVVDNIEKYLKDAGWNVERVQASWMIKMPTKILATLAGSSVQDLVAEQLATLRTPKIEVELHPSDIVINGSKSDAVHVRAVLSEHLAFSPAHLTWSKDANRVEDTMRGIWRDSKTGKLSRSDALARIRDVGKEMTKLDVPYDEWEVLFRERLLLEREVLERMTDEKQTQHEPEQQESEEEELTHDTGRQRKLAWTGLGMILVYTIGVLISAGRSRREK